MSDADERIRFETEELHGLAQQHGAKRVEIQPGLWVWQFPPWTCPHCGPDVEAQPGCPQPLARHGPIER